MTQGAQFSIQLKHSIHTPGREVPQKASVTYTIDILDAKEGDQLEREAINQALIHMINNHIILQGDSIEVISCNSLVLH